MRPERRHTLCASLSSQCISTCHKSRTIRKFTGNTPQTRVRSTQIRHLPLHLPLRTPQCGQTVWGIKRQTATACQRVTSELLDLSLARAHGHPGTTPIHGHTGTRAHGQSPPENQPYTGRSVSSRVQVCRNQSFYHCSYEHIGSEDQDSAFQF